MRAPLAITVMGGLFVSTLLTMFIVPAIFYDVEKILKKFSFKNIKSILGKISW